MNTRCAVVLAIVLLTGAMKAVPPLPPLPPGAVNAIGNPVTNPPAGLPPPTVSISLAWNDEGADGTQVTEYDVYYGMSVALSNVIVVTNWVATNGQVQITVSGMLTTGPYLFYVEAVGPLGTWDVSGPSADLEVIAPGYLLPSLTSNTNMISLSYFCFSNHAYSVQSSGFAGTNIPIWNTMALVTNFSGVTNYTAVRPRGNHFYRLLIQ